MLRAIIEVERTEVGWRQFHLGDMCWATTVGFPGPFIKNL